MLLSKTGISSPKSALLFKCSNFAVLSRMSKQTLFRFIFIVIGLPHIAESFTGDCKYCSLTLIANIAINLCLSLKYYASRKRIDGKSVATTYYFMW